MASAMSLGGPRRYAQRHGARAAQLDRDQQQQIVLVSSVNSSLAVH